MKKILFLSIFAALLLQNIASAQVPERVSGWPHIYFTGEWFNYAIPLIASDEYEQFLFYATEYDGLGKYNRDGSFAPGWPVPFETLMVFQPCPIVDIDHDGRYEMLVNGTRRDIDSIYSLIYLIDDDGSGMSGFPIRVRAPSDLNAVDMDGDNEYEILYFSLDEQIINCLDRFGQSKPG